jgi:hypothetical protein
VENSKILNLGLAFAIISLTSLQISAAEPFERLSPQEQALERKRQGVRGKGRGKVKGGPAFTSRPQQLQQAEQLEAERQAQLQAAREYEANLRRKAQEQKQARQATQQLPAYDPEEIRASREEFERKKRRQAEQEAEQLEAEYQAQAVQKKYSDIQPILLPLQQGLQRLEVQMQNLMERTDKLERAPKVAIEEQPVCCIETDGCTEDQGVGPIPCKNKHNDLICNACLNQIKNATNRCPICQEQLIG